MEGRKAVAEAVAAGAGLETVFVDPSAATQADAEAVAAAERAGAAVIEVQPGVLARVGDTVTPQPVAATVRAVDGSLDDLFCVRPALVAVLAGVADPGNAGSILRSVAAAGDGAVILCEASVDLYNPKTVRSSAGAVFRVPVVRDTPAEEVVTRLHSFGYRVLATAADGAGSYTETDMSGHVAVILGNEAHGVPPELLAAADATVSIPIVEGAESLGVAAAGAVIAFEAARQRRSAAGESGAPAARVAGAA